MDCIIMRMASICMRVSIKFWQNGSDSDNVFFSLFFMREERIQIPLKAGHHRPRQRNAIE